MHADLLYFSLKKNTFGAVYSYTVNVSHGNNKIKNTVWVDLGLLRYGPEGWGIGSEAVVEANIWCNCLPGTDRKSVV